MHCADLSNDGFVYVCDRLNDRLQVFRPDGTLLREVFIDKHAGLRLGVGRGLLEGSTRQRFVFVPDGINNRINILQRDTLEVLANFGDGGRLSPASSMACTASRSTPPATSTRPKPGRASGCRSSSTGLAPVTRLHQGTVWPPAPA
ncbi:MAG: hypothetical protein R2708_28545 [Vicinamibacterales bacterium]